MCDLPRTYSLALSIQRALAGDVEPQEITNWREHGVVWIGWDFGR